MPRALILVVTAGVAALTAAGCQADPPAPAEAVVRPVRYEIVHAAGTGLSRTFTGVAQAGSEATLSFRVPGIVTTLAVSVGDRVSPGDVIAEIDAADYSLMVKEAEAGLRQAEAQARNADADLRRVRGLYETDAASRDDLDAAAAGAASAGAQVEALTQRLEMANRQVTYTRLLAPTAGAIAEVRVEPNENVGAGQAVAIVTSEGRPEVEVGVSESVIARVMTGQRVRVQFDALPDQALTGTVSEVGVMAGAAATTFPVTVALSSGLSGVLPGMAASVSFDFPDVGGPSPFVVPTNAVGEDRDGRFVFVAEQGGDGQGVARRRGVTVGQLVAGGLEILTGLADGDALITAGVGQLNDGDTVRLDEAGG